MANTTTPHHEVNKLCLAPLNQFTPPSFNVPIGACDTHAHVVIQHHDHPFVDERSYTPPDAPEEKYLHMLASLGLSRGVLVQISVLGTDNQYLLQVLSRHRERLRGIAVVSPDISDQELAAMHDAGVRGIRINVLFGGGVGFDAIKKLAPRMAELGWHIQFLLDIRQLPELMPLMSKLPCPGVIDHMGHMPSTENLQHPALQAMFHLVQHRDFWVKLSGAYRLSHQQPNYEDILPLAQQLIRLAPERMVWGSDWPHVAVPNMPDTGHLLNLLGQWAPAPQLRQRILVDNPAQLYGF